MPLGEFRIEPVRRYRRAMYPARWMPPVRRRRRGRAAAFALALPIAAGGCWWEGAEDGGLRSTSPPAYLTEAEGIAVLERTIAHSDFRRPDACPTVPVRLRRDLTFVWDRYASGVPTLSLQTDLIAPQETIEPFLRCSGGTFPAVGFEFFAGSPGWWSSPYIEHDLEAALTGGIAGLRSFDHMAYSFDPGEIGDHYHNPPAKYASKAEAEAALEADVRAFIEELRRAGFI